tara:strand:+ start:1323 stop:1937 length:615 start_codon:yes stop_codon:yes gene_type:complete
MSLVTKLILILVLSGKIVTASEFQAYHLHKAVYCAELVRFTDRSGPLFIMRTEYYDKRELQSEKIKKNARDIISLGTFLDFSALGIEDSRRKLLELELSSHDINSDKLRVQRHWTPPLEFTISPEIRTELESCSAELSELAKLFNCSKFSCGPFRDFAKINEVLIKLNLEPIEENNLKGDYSLIDELTFKAAKLWDDFVKFFEQ